MLKNDAWCTPAISDLRWSLLQSLFKCLIKVLQNNLRRVVGMKKCKINWFLMCDKFFIWINWMQANDKFAPHGCSNYESA